MDVSKLTTSHNVCVAASVSLLMGALGFIAGPTVVAIVAMLALALAVGGCLLYAIGRFLLGVHENPVQAAALGTLFSILVTGIFLFWFMMIGSPEGRTPILPISPMQLAVILAAIAVFSCCITRKVGDTKRFETIITFGFTALFTSVGVALVLGIATKTGLLA